MTAPKWQQIADELRARIADGTRAPGAKLSTETELAAQFSVSRPTARQALTALANEGLLTSQAPRGWFVRERRPVQYQVHYRPQAEGHSAGPSPEMDAFMTEYSAEGREPRQDIEVAIVAPPAPIAQRLRLEPGEAAVVRRRMRYLDGEPFNLNDSYFPRDLVAGSEIMDPAVIARGANRVLAELGFAQERVLDEFHVRMPTPPELTRLALGPGTPVAAHVATGVTADGTPVRVVHNVLAGDRHVIVYERPMLLVDDPDARDGM
ncbi:MAG: GntR family transcriptional regulator [Nocardioides sp.]